MAIRTTITTRTKRCPYCGEIIDVEETDLTFQMILWILLALVMIPYFFIRLCLGFPIMPKVGPKFELCPSCSLPIRTANKSVDELNPEERITYRFRVWFRIGYILGGLWSILGLVALNTSGVPWFDIMWLLSSIGIIAIIVAYHVMLAKCKKQPGISGVTTARVEKNQEAELREFFEQLNGAQQKEKKQQNTRDLIIVILGIVVLIAWIVWNFIA